MTDLSVIDAELEALTQRWHHALDGVAADGVGRAGDLLTERLLAADSVQDYADARRVHTDVVRHAERVRDAMGGLLSRIDVLQAEWDARRRYTDAGLDDLRDQLTDAIAFDQADGLRRWLREVLKALGLAEDHAAARIAGFALPIEGDALAAVAELVEAIGAWNKGDIDTGLAITRAIADGRFGTRLGVSDVRIRVRAHRIAAWLSFEMRHDSEAAQAALDEAIALLPTGSRARSERAALFLRIDEIEQAINDAHRAIEARPDGATGHLVLGVCAEHTGDLQAADDLYRTGLKRMTTYELSTTHRRVSLLEPTGRMLLRVGERLMDRHRPDSALTVLDEALSRVIADPRAHPDAEVHALRSVALEQLSRRPEAAAAAVEAGKRFIWNDQLNEAIEQLGRAQRLDASLASAGWFLAEALVSLWQPDADTAGDLNRVDEALNVWEENRERFGWPEGRTSWAYVSRATIAEAGAYRPDADLASAIWEALLYVERAIVHELADETFADGARWAGAAHYLSLLQLDELALECSDRADALGLTTYDPLLERLALLAKAGRIEEMEQVGARVESAYGTTPWVDAVRGWAAYQDGRFADGLRLLEGPLSTGGDSAQYWLYGLAALCHLGLQDREGALAVFAAMRESIPADGVDRCAGAVACAALGDLPAARELLALAAGDEDTPRLDLDLATAFVETADGNAPAASARLVAAIGQATTTTQLDGLVRELDLQLEVLPLEAVDRQALRSELRTTIDAHVGERRGEIARRGPPAEAQLADALSSYAEAGLSAMPFCALLAIAARRLMRSAQHEQAADVYGVLADTPFAPEARVGLRRSLEAVSSDRASRGDVAGVREIQDMLSRQGLASVDSAALAIADALAADKRFEAAIRELEPALLSTTDAEAQRSLHERIATLAMVCGDPDLADRHLVAALELTDAVREAAHVGRLEVRRSIAAAMAKNLKVVPGHLLAALHAWERAGAFDPPVTLRNEVTMALGDLLAPAVASTLVGWLMPLLKRLGSASPDVERIAAVESEPDAEPPAPPTPAQGS